MGASLVYLNEPNTEIDQEDGNNSYLRYATGSMQGWRLNMVCNPNYICPSFVHQYLNHQKDGMLVNFKIPENAYVFISFQAV